jgi:ubiquinone/menaquinone biosynthesis C-methylase UbiE
MTLEPGRVPRAAGTRSAAQTGRAAGARHGTGIRRLILYALHARALWLVTICATAVMTASAQERPRHGRLFPPEELGDLEGPDRDAWQMPDAVMDAVQIADGSHVADIGAGGGWFTVRLARRVGPNGVVYAQDVQAQMLEAIRRRVDREGLRNVRTVRGDAADPRLPPASVEVVLIVDAYHEFTNRAAWLGRLATALKPGGRVGVLDFNKAGGGPGPPIDERVDEATVIKEANAAGLRLVQKETFLPFQYFLVFGRADDTSGGTAAETR